MTTRFPAIVSEVALCVAFSFGSPTLAATVYVRASALGPVHDGLSWTTAYSTVQAAIDASRSGDDVWVAAVPGGAYRELITLKDGVRLLGGFAGTETSESARNPAANSTTLDGMALGTVVTAIACAARTTLDGFTVTGGAGVTNGGGIRCSGGAPTITGNIIRSNTCGYFNGGGIACDNLAAPLIIGNTIMANTAQAGAGIWCENATPTIINNAIVANSTTVNGYGGGIMCYNASPLIRHNSIRNNTASAYGGGIGIERSTPIIVGNTISGNTASGFGGGIACTYASPRIVSNIIAANSTDFSGGAVSFITSNACLVNNTFEGNSAPVYGASVDLTDNAGAFVGNVVAFNTTGVILGGGQFTNNCVFGNSQFDYAAGDLTLVSGNIKADPLFTARATGDYSLSAGSPCRNTGDDLAILPADTDALDHPRVQGTHVDRGAVETVAAAGYRWWDVANALRICSGLSAAAAGDKAWLNVVAGTAIDVRDAVLLARKASGLQPNP